MYIFIRCVRTHPTNCSIALWPRLVKRWLELANNARCTMKERNRFNPLARAMSMCALALLALTCVSLGEEAAIYPFQEDVEAHLKGTLDECRRYALLLPLQVGMMEPGVEFAYSHNVLSKIDELDMKEALPFLEKGLCWDSTYWEGTNRSHAARLWLRFRTSGMNDVERTKFLASTFRPGFPYRVQEEAGNVLEEMGPIGRRSIIEMLRTLDVSFTSNYDELIAGTLRRYLSQSDKIQMSREEADELASSQNPFEWYIAMDWFSVRADRKAVDIAIRLIGVKEARRLRGSILYGLAHCPGGDDVFRLVLHDARSEGESVDEEYTVQIALSYLTSALSGPFRIVSDGLRAEVAREANREIQPLRNPWGEELKLFGYQHANRETARRILEVWQSQKPTKDGK